MSLFSHLEPLPADPILGTALAFKADPDPRKVNLGIGAYRDEEGKPYIFEVVKKIEAEMLKDAALNKEYFPEDGLASLKELTQKMNFGESRDNICSIQSLSGTGALRIAAEFIKNTINPDVKVYVSSPSWANHPKVFLNAGLETEEYPYWNGASKTADIRAMVEFLRTRPRKSVVVLHACAHNPTGMDPTEEEWRSIVEVVVSRNHIPILDSAYQGYASGDPERDALAVRMFYKSGIEFFVTQSFAKNMGLYGERIGMLHVVCADADRAHTIWTHLKIAVRRMYSNPPIHGAHIVARILGDPQNFAQWLDEIKKVSGRIQRVRKELYDGLVAKGTPGKWDHITRQIGMFSFTGLNQQQSERMISVHHIYMLKNGRISMAGLNKSNLQYVVDAIDECVRNTSNL